VITLEFYSRAMERWVYVPGVQSDLSPPGNPSRCGRHLCLGTIEPLRPNHFALPLFFLLLLALFSGLLVASFHAFSDIEILRRRVFGLRRQVSDLLSLNGSESARPGDPGKWGTSLFRE
jgi:hypothetical protein